MFDINNSTEAPSKTIDLTAWGFAEGLIWAALENDEVTQAVVDALEAALSNGTPAVQYYARAIAADNAALIADTFFDFPAMGREAFALVDVLLSVQSSAPRYSQKALRLAVEGAR